MKDIKLIVWITQLGVAVVFPLAGAVLLAVWLRDRYGWGDWVVVAGIVLGVIGAVDGLRTSLKTMERLSKEKKKDDGPKPLSFNDHD